MSWYARIAEAKQRIFAGEAGSQEQNKYNVAKVEWYPESGRAVLTLCEEEGKKVTLKNVHMLIVPPYGGEEYDVGYDYFTITTRYDGEPVTEVEFMTPGGKACFSAEYISYYMYLELKPHGAKV